LAVFGAGLLFDLSILVNYLEAFARKYGPASQRDASGAGHCDMDIFVQAVYELVIRLVVGGMARLRSGGVDGHLVEVPCQKQT